MPKQTLNDRGLKALKQAAPGKRRVIQDAVVPGLAIKVTDRGHKSFVLIKRYPGSRNPAPRSLGEYGAISLEQARNKARDWLELIRKGIDPAVEEERQRQAEVRRQENTFCTVFEAFFVDKLAKERKGEDVARDIRNEFLPKWKMRPITDIIDLDVLAIINAKKTNAPAQARNLLGEIRRLFGWAIKQRVYGITTNPCDSLSPKDIIGKKRRGQRILENDELFALWRAVKRLRYPYRQAYQLLMLTALRLNEAVRAPWTEFPAAVARALRQREKDERIDWTKVSNEPLAWIVTAERMKGENEEARPHLVPLTTDILAVLESLPLFRRGDYLFSTTFGKKPVSIGDKIKKKIDARMLRTLKALARRRGDDPAKVKLKNWTNHDIRRTVRSNLSRLRVTEEAREAVIAHARPGIKGTYDVYDYADEKREALDLWASRLRSIVEPPPDNVVQLRAQA
jgi:hypothetical protein